MTKEPSHCHYRPIVTILKRFYNEVKVLGTIIATL